MTDYRKIDDHTLLVRSAMPPFFEGAKASLSRIFNFKAREITTIYEQGILKNYKIPGHSSHIKENGYTTALTSAMQIQKFSACDSQDEIIEMHAKLISLKGNPPALSELLPRFHKAPFAKE